MYMLEVAKQKVCMNVSYAYVTNIPKLQESLYFQHNNSYNARAALQLLYVTSIVAGMSHRTYKYNNCISPCK